MADDRNSRDKQAQDEEQRQRERALATELARRDEPEPPVDTETLTDLETDLDSLDFPATGADVVEAVGDREVDSHTGSYTVAQLIPETEAETFDAPGAVRVQIRRPTVASAMKRVIEATAAVPHATLDGSQRKAYERTFRELGLLDPEDDDEGVGAIADWVVEQIRDKGKLPGSRAVRRQAAKFCRANGYEVRTDEWLGI